MVGCGCDRARKADRMSPRDEGRVPLELEAREEQRRWRCPAAGYLPGTLDDEARAVACATAKLVGAEGATYNTCPLFSTRLSWVHRAVRAHQWAERGGDPREPEPHPVLIDAVDVLDDAHGVRRAADDARRERERTKS